MQNTFQIDAPNAAAGLNNLLRLAEHDEVNGCQASLTIHPAQGVTWTASAAGSSIRTKSPIPQAVAAYESHPNMGITAKLQVKDPSGSNQTITVILEERESSVGYVIRLENSNAPPEHFLRIVTAIEATFNTIPHREAIAKGLPDFAQRLVDITIQSTQSLQDAAGKIADSLAEQARASEQYYAETDKRLQGHYEAKDKQRDQTLREELKKIADREAEVLQKEATLNLKESRGVRRELMKRLEDVLKDQKEFAVIEKTSEKRTSVQNMCYLGLFAGAFLFVVGYGAAVGQDNPNPIAYSPVIAGTAIFAGTLIYYIRWSNAWFHRHADQEFQNAQFQKDIIRASWIVELLFEAQQGVEGSDPS